MSSSVLFPSFTVNGLGWPVKRKTIFSTKIQDAISGKETRIAYWSYPKYSWTADINALQSITSANDFALLMGFINLRQGSFDTFLYTDADQSSVTNQAIATGNGSTAAYQLINTYGGFIEPVLAPNTVSTVSLAGVSIPTAGYSAPGAAALSSSAGGSLSSTTYYVKCTWVTNSGETLPGTESNLAVAANHVLVVTQPSSPPAGAVNWRIYVSNTGGSGSGAETLQATVAIGTTSWTEPTSGLVAGAALPGSNTTGWTVANWGSTNPGYLTFGGNVANGIAITSTFTFYYPCRFLSDSQEFSLIYQSMYQCQKISWQTVKN